MSGSQQIKTHKKVSLLEIFIKKPCNECLVKACCTYTRECDELYRWYHKYRFFIEINELSLLIFGVTIMVLITIFDWIGIVDKKSAQSCANKIAKLVEENIK